MRRILLSLCLAIAALSSPTLAQEVNVAFGQSLRLDGSQLEITADSLSVDQTTGASIFSGNVVAQQDTMRIMAQDLRIEYEAGAAPGSQRIGQLIASGGVTMVTSAEAIEAREAVYSLTAQTLEMTGDVVLAQGANVLSGQRFIADLRNGSGRMIGRVRTIIRVD